jgi:hypothetical protein
MSSPFASQTVSDPIPLPFDEGQWIRVRALTGKEFEQAQDAHRREFSGSSSRSWSMVFRRILETGNPAPEDVLAAIRDPLTGFDRYAVARMGLIEWSYPQSVKPVLVEGKPVEPVDAIADLKDDPIDFIAREVLRLTKPSLFLASEEDAKAAQKNG